MNNTPAGKIIEVNGPVVKASSGGDYFIGEQLYIGELRIPGEIIRTSRDHYVIQAYEDTAGLKIGDDVFHMGEALSVELGPGLLGSIFDGLQRPLVELAKASDFIERGKNSLPLPRNVSWKFNPLAQPGDEVSAYSIVGVVRENPGFAHKIMIPEGVSGRISHIVPAGEYKIDDTIAVVENNGRSSEIKMFMKHPVRTPLGSIGYVKSDELLFTGQRVLDFFFPIVKGGTAVIPGGFGAGKTVTQHQLAKWCDADIIVYIGCGERGNEMVQVLEDFPKLKDPRSKRALMERTVLIANTSNMPVTAREASIYTGITIAEYFRNMGCTVALMADSTSRWAEALREISGRLEELPVEEGFPSYLSHRIANFYERAGKRRITHDRTGSISVIGAVSPPGGDFSEPVTIHSKRYTKIFWALDKDLASSRHFPSINWIQSFSGYLEQAQAHWSKISSLHNWTDLRQEAMDILIEDDNLQKVVKLIGADALPEQQRLQLLAALLIKEGFLQQAAFDATDSYCSPEKQLLLIDVILYFYRKAKLAVDKKIPVSEMQNLKVLLLLLRAKSEIDNENAGAFESIKTNIDSSFDELEVKYGQKKN